MGRGAVGRGHWLPGAGGWQQSVPWKLPHLPGSPQGSGPGLARLRVGAGMLQPCPLRVPVETTLPDSPSRDVSAEAQCGHGLAQGHSASRDSGPESSLRILSLPLTLTLGGPPQGQPTRHPGQAVMASPERTGPARSTQAVPPTQQSRPLATTLAPRPVLAGRGWGILLPSLWPEHATPKVLAPHVCCTLGLPTGAGP